MHYPLIYFIILTLEKRILRTISAIKGILIMRIEITSVLNLTE